MFDVIAADQHQAAATIDCGCVDDGKARLTATRIGAAQTVSAEAAHQPGGEADQGENDRERDEEFRGQRQCIAEQIEH